METYVPNDGKEKAELRQPTVFEMCKFIRETCLKVNAHPKVTVTALLAFHKVYEFEEMQFIFKASFDEMDPYAVATSCVWVATKGCEELQLRLRDLVNVVHRALNPDSKPLALDDDYYDLRDTVTTVELLVWRILEFKIPVPKFFNYLIKFLYSLEKWHHGRIGPHNEINAKVYQAVSRTAISIMLDGLQRPIFLQYDDPSVALACLDMSVKIHNLQIPLDDFCRKSWRKALYSDASWGVIKNIQENIMKVYEEDEENFMKNEL